MRELGSVSVNKKGYALFSKSGDPFMVRDRKSISSQLELKSSKHHGTGKFSSLTSITGMDSLAVCTGDVCLLSEGVAKPLVANENAELQLPPSIIPIFDSPELSPENIEEVRRQNAVHRQVRHNELLERFTKLLELGRYLFDELQITEVNHRNAWLNLSQPVVVPKEHEERNLELRRVLTDQLNDITRSMLDDIEPSLRAVWERLNLYNRGISRSYDWNTVLSRSL